MNSTMDCQENLAECRDRIKILERELIQNRHALKDTHAHIQEIRINGSRLDAREIVILEDLLWKFEHLTREGMDVDDLFAGDSSASEIHRKLYLENLKLRYAQLKLKRLDLKSEIIILKRRHFISFLSDLRKKDAKLFYGLLYGIVAVFGFIALTVKFFFYHLNIFDLAEFQDYLIGGLLNRSFWASVFLFALAYGFIPMVQLKRLMRYRKTGSGKPHRRSVNLLFLMHKKPTFVLFVACMVIIPSAASNLLLDFTNSVTDPDWIKSLIPMQVRVTTKNLSNPWPPLVPVHRLKNYHVFKAPSNCEYQAVVIPVANISAIYSEPDAVSLQKPICRISTETPEPGTEKTHGVALSFSREDKLILSNLINRIEGSFTDDIAYLENYLIQEKRINFRIIRELDTIYFSHGSRTIGENAGRALKNIAKVIDNGSADLVIVGYANTQGSDDYNKALSEDRAEAVKHELMEAVRSTNFDTHRIQTVGVGERLYERGQSEEGPTNRRARVFVVDVGSANENRLAINTP